MVTQSSLLYLVDCVVLMLTNLGIRRSVSVMGIFSLALKGLVI